MLRETTKSPQWIHQIIRPSFELWIRFYKRRHWLHYTAPQEIWIRNARSSYPDINNVIHSMPLYIFKPISKISWHVTPRHTTNLFLSGFPMKITFEFLFSLTHSTCTAHLTFLSLILVVDCVLNVMAHAKKPDFAFWRRGLVHLNRRGRQFIRLLAADVCASAVVMLDTPCSEVM